MFALAAIVSAVLGFCNVTLDGHSFIWLVGGFIAAELLFSYRPWIGRRTP